MTSDEQFKFIAALDRYGIGHQTDMAIEEMSELIKALLKLRRNLGGIADVTEEIADVEIVLDQIKTYYSIDSDVLSIREQKIERLMKRMEEDK